MSGEEMPSTLLVVGMGIHRICHRQFPPDAWQQKRGI